MHDCVIDNPRALHKYCVLIIFIHVELVKVRVYKRVASKCRQPVEKVQRRLIRIDSLGILDHIYKSPWYVDIFDSLYILCPGKINCTCWVTGCRHARWDTRARSYNPSLQCSGLSSGVVAPQCPNPFLGGPQLQDVCSASSGLVFLTMLNSLLVSSPKIGDPCGRVKPIKTPALEYDFIVVGGTFAKKSKLSAV